MIQVLCYRQAESIIDVKLSNPDADSYRFQSMAELLASWKKINKHKHGDATEEGGGSVAVIGPVTISAPAFPTPCQQEQLRPCGRAG